MEKHTSVLSKKVGNYIPGDISFSILSKLPLKSLSRFGCVCKSWILLFENPNFIDNFCNNFISNHDSYYDDTFLLLHHVWFPFEIYCWMYSLSGERFENKVKLDYPNPFPDDGPFYFILDSGSINGTLCLYSVEMEFVLWNPKTKEFKAIPRSPNELLKQEGYLSIVPHGFGYDYIKDDYKLIRCVGFEDPNVVSEYSSWPPVWEIYSLKETSWRKLDVDMPHCHHKFSGVRLYKDEMCHWWGRDNDEHWLVSFDLGNEVFFTTPIPSLDIADCFDTNFVSRYLVVLNGSIALISWYDDTATWRYTTTFYISVLGELGVKESWTKLFVVGPLPCDSRPIGVGMNGNIFFIKRDGEIILFSSSTQMIRELGVKGKSENTECYMVIYKESHLPIGGIIN